MPSNAAASDEPSRAADQRAAARKATSVRAKTTSVILQARVDGALAEELLTKDAVVLGLEGPSDVVREGLRLVHRRAQEQELINSYDDFYSGKRAPLPAGVAQPQP